MTPTTATPPRTPTATPPISTATSHPTMRMPALVAGIGTLLLAVLSGWANFGVIEALVTEGNAAQTAQDILAAEATFRLGVVCLLLTAMLDVVVAWALRAFFAPVHRAVSTLAAWLRTVYAGVFALAITHLAGALNVLENAEAATALSSEQVQAEAFQRIESFHLVWDLGLVLFGLHLLAIGYLAFRSNYVPRLLGLLVAVAGFGYVTDSLGALLVPGSLPEVAAFTFVGEVLLLIWLLARGRNVTPTPAGHAS